MKDCQKWLVEGWWKRPCGVLSHFIKGSVPVERCWLAGIGLHNDHVPVVIINCDLWEQNVEILIWLGGNVLRYS